MCGISVEWLYNSFKYTCKENMGQYWTYLQKTVRSKNVLICKAQSWGSWIWEVASKGKNQNMHASTAAHLRSNKNTKERMTRTS